MSQLKYDWSSILLKDRFWGPNEEMLERFLYNPVENYPFLIDTLHWRGTKQGVDFWQAAFGGKEPQLTEAIRLLKEVLYSVKTLDDEDIWE